MANVKNSQNIDLLHRLLTSLDPDFCSLRKPPTAKKAILTTDILPLLKDPEIYFTDSDKE